MMERIWGLSNEEEGIFRIKPFAYCLIEPTIQIGAIDTLASYGKQAIGAITKVINLSNIDDHVKERAEDY